MQATAAATMLLSSQVAPRFVGGGGGHPNNHSTAAPPRGVVTTNGAAITGGGGGGGLPFAARSRYAASVAPFRGGGGNRKAAASHRGGRGGRRHNGRGSSVAPSASASDSATGGGGEVEKTEDGVAVYPLNSAGRGWDPAEMHKLTGMVWSFTTPSSTDGRKIVKYSCEQAGVKLKGASNWRKEDWENAAKEAGVTFLDTYSSLSGMRGEGCEASRRCSLTPFHHKRHHRRHHRRHHHISLTAAAAAAFSTRRNRSKTLHINDQRLLNAHVHPPPLSVLLHPLSRRRSL